MNTSLSLFKKNKNIIIFTFAALIILSSIFVNKKLNLISQTNLIKFHSLTSNDPLFYDPNTDLNHLNSALQSLKKLDDETVQVNSSYLDAEPNNYKFNVFPKGWTIWPEKFLATLPQIHELTTEFLAKPTPRKATELLDNYERATKQYKNAIDLNIQAMETFLSRSPEFKKESKYIVFLRSATTAQIVLDDFMVIRKNAQALEREIIERKKCLYNGLCLKKVMNEPFINDKDSVKITFKPLPDKILDIDRSKDIVFGPYYASTGCFLFTEDQKSYNHPFFVVEKGNGLRNGLIMPMLTNTKFYQDFRSQPEQATSLMWREHGYLIRNQEAINDYLCNDLRYVPLLYLNYLTEKRGANSSLSTRNVFSVLPYLADRSALGTYLLLYYKENKKPQNPLYMLVNRSAYSLYFGTFTSRIWRLPYSPTFLIKKPVSKFPEINVSFEDLIAQGYSHDKIAKFNLHIDPRTAYQDALIDIIKSPSNK